MVVADVVVVAFDQDAVGAAVVEPRVDVPHHVVIHELVLGDRRVLRVRPGFDTELLLELVRLLEEPLC